MSEQNDPNWTEPAADETEVDAAMAEVLSGAAVSPSADFGAGVLGAVRAATAATDPARSYHLAQMNTARFHQPMDHPDMSGFVEMLDPINHQADAADGFVWRLTDESSNNATSITYYDDPLLLVNLSVWTDLESLRTYVYRTAHVDMVKRRDEWAEATNEAHIVLWWVPAGHCPDIAEADAKLRQLRAEGPTPEAFTFGRHFPPPD